MSGTREVRDLERRAARRRSILEGMMSGTLTGSRRYRREEIDSRRNDERNMSLVAHGTGRRAEEIDSRRNDEWSMACLNQTHAARDKRRSVLRRNDEWSAVRGASHGFRRRSTREGNDEWNTGSSGNTITGGPEEIDSRRNDEWNVRRVENDPISTDRLEKE